MIGRALRSIPYRVVIPATMGSLLYLGWLEIDFLFIKFLSMNGGIDTVAEIKPRNLIIDTLFAADAYKGAIIFALFVAPFLAGMLCGIAFTRNLKINRNMFTTPIYIGMVVGSLLTVLFPKRKSAGRR